jgi:hypothetical protein
VITEGTGRVLSSGRTLHGERTQFLKELKVGDKIIVTLPDTLQKFDGVVMMILGDKSAQLSKPLSQDVITHSPF